VAYSIGVETGKLSKFCYEVSDAGSLWSLYVVVDPISYLNRKCASGIDMYLGKAFSKIVNLVI